MRKLHFFSAHSRMGIKNKPLGSSKQNIGVEYGSDAILKKGFLDSLKTDYQITNYDFPIPEKVSKDNYEKVLADNLSSFRNRILNRLEDDETQVVIGGDHSVSFSSLDAVLRRYYAKTVGCLHIDSHGDLHKFATSPSDNFNGMWLRPFVGNFDNKDINSKIKYHLPPENLLLIGNLDLQDSEMHFMRSKNIETINQSDLIEINSMYIKQLDEFISKFAHLHVSLDIDVFDRTLAPATGSPIENGFLKEHLWPVLEMISQHPDLSVDLVEVNPHRKGVIKTVKLAREVLKTLLLGKKRH